MAFSGNQIIARALSKAKAPAYTAQAQLELNIILREVCQNYDLAIARSLITGVFNPGLTETVNGVLIFGGPIILPADYLRTSGSSGSEGAGKSAWYVNVGVPYPMVPCDLAEFDMQVQQAGLNSLPWQWVTDMSQTPPEAFVYPPPSGAFPYFVRYQRLMPDMTDFTQPPWFTDTTYLITRLAGRMMQDSDDARSEKMISDSDAMLIPFLRQTDDKTNRAQTVQHDRRSFGGSWRKLKTTKSIGWP